MEWKTVFFGPEGISVEVKLVVKDTEELRKIAYLLVNKTYTLKDPSEES